MREQFSVMREQFSVMREQFSVMREQFSVMREQFSVMREQFIVMREQFSVMREQFLESCFCEKCTVKCVSGTVFNNVTVNCVRSRRSWHWEVHNVKVRKLCSPLVFTGDKISDDEMEGHVERMGQMCITVWSRETGCETCV